MLPTFDIGLSARTTAQGSEIVMHHEWLLIETRGNAKKAPNTVVCSGLLIAKQIRSVLTQRDQSPQCAGVVMCGRTTQEALATNQEDCFPCTKSTMNIFNFAMVVKYFVGAVFLP
jgi:hypothetical protein